MGPVGMAVQGKGIRGMLRRTQSITSHYGVTANKMDCILREFVDILRQFNCAATFPITAIALARSKGVVEKYQPDNIEFAVHGYYHVDHSLLSLDQQVAHLAKTRQLFRERGIAGEGFRCPYLRWSNDTMAAVAQNGFLYDSSQAIYWDVVSRHQTEDYLQALEFYRAVAAVDYPALPYFDGALVRIPYCLPDDESLVERLHLDQRVDAYGPLENPWLKILAETTRLGELFTLGLHPERISACKGWLIEVLRHARSTSPAIWMARLDEVAHWWRARMETEVTVTQESDRTYRLDANGPAGLGVLIRGVNVLSPATDWDGVYLSAEGTTVTFEAEKRPFIGVSPDSDAHLTDFLRQQGYIVEVASAADDHSLYLERSHFKPEDERAILADIEGADFPLVRLGRWPNRAKSALVVTGDVDALTIWDYGLRILGI